MARKPSTYSDTIFIRSSINGTFIGLIGLIIFAGGAYVKEYEDEIENGQFAEVPWFYASSAQYGWPGDEIPAAVILSEEEVIVPDDTLRLQ